MYVTGFGSSREKGEHRIYAPIYFPPFPLTLPSSIIQEDPLLPFPAFKAPQARIYPDFFEIQVQFDRIRVTGVSGSSAHDLD